MPLAHELGSEVVEGCFTGGEAVVRGAGIEPEGQFGDIDHAHDFTEARCHGGAASATCGAIGSAIGVRFAPKLDISDNCSQADIQFQNKLFLQCHRSIVLRRYGY